MNNNGLRVISSTGEVGAWKPILPQLISIAELDMSRLAGEASRQLVK
jgi:hypothetical protein